MTTFFKLTSPVGQATTEIHRQRRMLNQPEAHAQPEAAIALDAPTSTPREQLVRATAAILARPQIEIVMRHYFADGVYGREGEVPKGAWFAGRVHHKAQINIISKGAVVVLTENGVIEMRAPCTLVSPPGAQRSAYALEDTVWTTLIATDETDPELIFETLTSPTFESFEVARNELLKIIEG